MRRGLTVAFLIIINLVIQSTLFKYIEVIQITPNTALIIIICYAILRGDVEGALVGFFAGLLQDIFFGKYIGMHALLGMITGYFCGKPFKGFYYENFLLPILLVTVSSLGYEFIFYVTNYLFRARLDYALYFSKIILPVTVYNLLICTPIYILVYNINKRLELNEKEYDSKF